MSVFRQVCITAIFLLPIVKGDKSPEQELAFSEIMKKTAQAHIIESTLEREGTKMTTEHAKVLLSSK